MNGRKRRQTVDPRSRFSTHDYGPIRDTDMINFGIKLLLSQNWGACVYTGIWKKDFRGSRAPRIMSARVPLRIDRNQLVRMQH